MLFNVYCILYNTSTIQVDKNNELFYFTMYPLISHLISHMEKTLNTI